MPPNLLAGPAGPAGAPGPASPASRLRRVLPWTLLVVLVAVAQAALLFLTVAYESARAQDEAEATAAEAAAGARRDLLRLLQRVQLLPAPGVAWADAAATLLRERAELRRLERRSEGMAELQAIDSPLPPPPFRPMSRRELAAGAEDACAAARRAAAPIVSRSYYMPLPGGLGSEIVDLCVPLAHDGAGAGYVVASVALAGLLEGVLSEGERRRYELSFVEADGTRLARAGPARGAGVFRAERVVDLPGHTLLLRADSTAGRPALVPNLAVALVLGLSIALFVLLVLLARDLRRRTQAERALAEALSLRRAMEDSLPTGLRAGDMAGRLSYANPAFCAMVGFTLDELRRSAEPPYWPPEHAAEYAARQQQRLAGGGRGAREAREGFETVFMRKNGERFPVMIFEAPLRAGPGGAQTGWMGAVLDLSAQRRVEELSRQQQDRLAATARLAMVGEMASLLSHELNQPLAAIAGYAHGSLNLIDAPAAEGDDLPSLLRQALARIAEQAERAGRVIKSVHDFVRRREQARDAVAAATLIDGVLPLVRLQARKSGTRVEVALPPAALPPVAGDRTMLEQVLLNLARNGIQAMETGTEPAERVLMIRVAPAASGVRFEVADAGPGIEPDVAARLFTPFFTTRSEGMGLGLSLCRTVVEQHGGTLEHRSGPGGRGTVFGFTLPAARAGGRGGDAPAAAVPESGDTVGAPATPLR
jgi:two-component system sensor histidine kinase DctS